MANSKTIKISELQQDDKNFNKGTELGKSLIEKSFEKFGAGRSILIDKNNRIISGNKTSEGFQSVGGENVLVVETDGKTLIAVKRNDIDLDTPEGREMALADNAAAKSNIEWDAEMIAETVSPEVIESWAVEAKLDDIENIEPKEKGPIFKLTKEVTCPNCSHKFKA